MKLKPLLLVLSMVSFAYGQEKKASNPMLASFLKVAERDARDMEKAHINALKSADAARFVDLGEKTLRVINESIPKGYEKYQALLKGEEGILKSDAGRFHSQNPETVEIIMRYAAEDVIPSLQPNRDELDSARIDFGASERNQRAKIVSEAVKQLKADTGETFSLNSPLVKSIEQNTAWASRAWETITQRNILLEGYLDAVVEGVDVSKLPTMQEEIEATIHRRMVNMGKALNEVERAAAEEKVKRMAEITQGIEASKLKAQIEAVESLAEEQARLEKAKADQEKKAVEIAASIKIQQTKEEYENAMASLRDQQAVLEKQLAEKALEVDEIIAEKENLAKKLQVTEEMRAMPADAKILVRILSAKGFWAPGPIKTSSTSMRFSSSRYESLEPVPHSLTSLAAAGALNEDAKGLLVLYGILSITKDTERPRLQGGLRAQRSTGTDWKISFEKDSFSSALTQNEQTRKTTKKLQAIQKILREYGDQLVEEGLLQP